MSSIGMISRIELERKNSEKADIIKLNLDNCQATEIEGLSSEFKSLQSLSIANVGLTTLTGFPSLPQLIKLNLANNEISNGLDALCECSGLIYLNLSGNKIKSLNDINAISKFENLKSLVLENNTLASTEDYRSKVFEILPHLTYLDGVDKNGNEETKMGDLTNGINNDHKDSNHTNGDNEDDEEEESDEDDVDDVGLSALQGSKDLDEDEEEEDYVPGDEEDLDDHDDDEEADEEDDEEIDEDETANLSGAGVTEPRRATKRCTTEEAELDREAKCKNTNETGDHDEAD